MLLRQQKGGDKFTTIVYLQQCLPDFGYSFNAGGQYGIQVETFFTDARRPGGNCYSASFRLYREQGVLKVARAG
ncbi:putative T6SS immunity periplasmic lipoprotein [Serratia rhizosphaerae]|uniref:putative T6SS immunity periplasmic lipoprotein n=1 Tax=Serratia rhizosphaerae TaxID=2597702 RepID=UPI002DB7528B|nr:hypothetical protein [Serratia rhizosphaerae]MEB6337845.1 hypothetical protein [Serratia rhizosphaerae]